MKFAMKILSAFALSFGAAQATLAVTVVDVAVAADAKQTRQDIWPMVTEFLMSGAKGDVVTVTDAAKGTRVATLKVTEEMGSSPNPTARTTWLLKQQGGEVAKAKQFFADKAPAASDADFVRWARSIELRKTEFPGAARIEAVFFGSPLVLSPEAYSMKNRYPGDAFLALADNNLFSTVGKEKSLVNVDVHVVHSPNLAEFSDRDRDFHQAKIKRFYGLFVQRLGGNLASFSGTSDHLKNITKTTFQKIGYGPEESAGSKPVVWEVRTPQLERQDMTRQKSLWDGAIQQNPSAPTRQSAPFDIGITWNKNVDIDIYVMPPGDKELSYKQTFSEKYGGRFIKDIVSLPGTNGFETVVYERDVPLREIRVYVNHYAGTTREPIDAELRIRVDGATYAKKFRLPVGQGNRGDGNRDANPAWIKLDISQILGLVGWRADVTKCVRSRIKG